MGRRAVRILLLTAPLLCTGCAVGWVVGTAADVAIEAAKIPFKVGAAVVDVATDEDEPAPQPEQETVSSP